MVTRTLSELKAGKRQDGISPPFHSTGGPEISGSIITGYALWISDNQLLGTQDSNRFSPSFFTIR